MSRSVSAPVCTWWFEPGLFLVSPWEGIGCPPDLPVHCQTCPTSHFASRATLSKLMNFFKRNWDCFFLRRFYFFLTSYFLRTLSSGWMNSFRYRDPLHYIVRVCLAVKILRRRSSDFSAVSPPAASPCITCHCRSLSLADSLDCHVTETTFLLHLGW